MASMMREAPALADKKLYSASAMATAQIEGKQHYDELERQGVLGIIRKTRIRGRLADGVPSPSYWTFRVKMSFVLTLLTDRPMIINTIPVPKRIQAIFMGVNRGW